MNIKNTGHSAEFLKRKAKSLKKELGLSHTEALNLISKNHGFLDWNDFFKNGKVTPRPKGIIRRPKAPEPATLNYYGFYSGNLLGQHPNTKMSIKRHTQVGDLLYELLSATEYHKRAKKHLKDIRSILDTWLGCEYKEPEVGIVEFNRAYYAKEGLPYGDKPSLKRQAELQRKLRKAKQIVDRSYHDCKPLDKLHEKFLMAEKAIEKWPKSAKKPEFNLNKDISAGAFVRIDDTKKIGMVFRQDKRSGRMEIYTDSGYATYSLRNVSVLKKQPDIKDFKPMRLYLPMGKWNCADGKEILFNRDYCPLWERSVTGEVTAISPEINVAYVESEFYFDSGCAPYKGYDETLEICLSVLRDWDVLEKSPKILELIPQAIAAEDVRLMSPKGFS